MVAAADILAKSIMIRVWCKDRRQLFLAAATKALQEAVGGVAGRQAGGASGRRKLLVGEANGLKGERQVG